MSPVILLGLIVMWVVVLVPMWLKRHDEVEENRSVNRFTSAMHTLSHHEDDRKRFHRSRPNSSREVHVSGASADGQRVRLPRRRSRDSQNTGTRAPKRHASPALRRRRLLVGLVLLAVLTAAGAVLHGGRPAWAVQIVADLALVGFVLHLRSQARNRVAAQRRARRRVAREAAGPVYSVAGSSERRAAMREQVIARSARAARAEQVEARYDEVVEETSYVEAGSADEQYEVGEQTAYAEERRAARVGSEPVYAPSDESSASEARVTVRRYERAASRQAVSAASARRAAADASAGRRRRVEFEEPEVAASGGDGTWEPVPVPRPVYTTKPTAPPRRRRAPLTEPLLPSAETAADLHDTDELEEILDRRWAVND